jgi:predicted unusual protein kinase regulating ubiquinone biosynthesis (AarF/ABC1/UbiB family)
MPRIPSSRLGRSARFGGLVAGQGLRWAGTTMANRSRSDERAQEALDDRALQTADELVAVLGSMKGAAMKFGQVLSTIDLEVVPEARRDEFKAKLAELRDAAPSVPFAKLRKIIDAEVGDEFASIDDEPLAAASIGQVHRAVTRDGREVAVKVQYPGVAEAVESDLRNLGLVLPLVKRLAPGLDVKPLAAELRERVSEELDYELEAQHQRAVARAFREHPFIRIPAVDTRLSTRRVLVTELVRGRGFEEVKALDAAQRARFGETVVRFFFGLLRRESLCAGDPHPGNYLLTDDGSVCFLDFGLLHHVPPEVLEHEVRLAAAFVAGDRDDARTRARRLAPEALLVRRMEGLVVSVVGDLRIELDWPRLVGEVYGGDPPSTPLGEEEAVWLSGQSPRRAA